MVNEDVLVNHYYCVVCASYKNSTSDKPTVGSSPIMGMYIYYYRNNNFGIRPKGKGLSILTYAYS